MNDMNLLLGILEESVAKNGEKPLTNLWLLNLLKMEQAKAEALEQESDLLSSEFDLYR
jgi:hypothetical protein